METTLLICDTTGRSSPEQHSIQAEIQAREEQLRILKRNYDVLFQTNNGLKEQLRVILERYEAKHTELDQLE
jgi:chromosome segregation ATPase